MIGAINTSGWSVCNYSFNATQQDLQAGGTNRFQSVLGIKALEFKIKLPQISNSETMLNMFPADAMGKMENGDGLAVMIMYQKLGATNSFYISVMESGTNHSVGTPLVL